MGLGGQRRFAAVGLAVAVLASSLVVWSIRHIPLDQGVGPVTNAKVGGGPGPELSRNGRLAYWREDPAGGALLYAQNLDGSLRRPVVRVESIRRVSRTRWTTDGSALTYIEGGTRAVVLRLDGTSNDLVLPQAEAFGGRRIVDQRWSPDSSKVAFTVKREADGRHDVWLAQARGAELVRATTLDDAIADDWISPNELLVQSANGLLGVLGDGVLAGGPANAIRPITGAASASPIVGEDGRLYYVAGRTVPGPSDAAPTVYAAGALWSSFVDGSDARKVRDLPNELLKIDAHLTTNTLLVHRNEQTGQTVNLGSTFYDIPGNAGLVERVAVAPDRRSAIGFVPRRVVRIDLTRPASASVSVLLDGVIDADAWYPRTATLSRPAPAEATRLPDARFAFNLAGSTWTMGRDGVPALLRTPGMQASFFRRLPTPLPLWSPRGDRLLTTEVTNTTTGAFGALLVDPRTGAAKRLEAFGPVGRNLAWSPDGASVAAVAIPGPGVAQLPDTLEVRFATVDDTIARAAVPGREVAWTGGGLFVISNGTFVAEPRSRTGLAVERVDGTTLRPVVTMATLMADPRALATATAATPAISDLGASADGAYVSVRLTYAIALGEAPRSFLTITRTDTGRPALYIPQETTADVQWSPRRALIGYTTVGPVAAGTRTVTATVLDPATGQIVSRVEGSRFAGWAPDAAAFYVARESGLFHHAIGAATGVKVSPIGVPVSLAPARP
ncbi:MAG: hypothetical protein FJ034_03925 [Chloroflexi bacterium]|nr:hypothetical protein [Chloroflexota bacterium]